MYSLMKKIITEKDIQRHVTLLELLLNHPKITVNELANEADTTERTVFSDLQMIRTQLPDGWVIDSDQAGIHLNHQPNLLANDLWEIFLRQSISVQLLKELLVNKQLRIPSFLNNNGMSYETLKRHVKKLNLSLSPYHLQIKLTRHKAEITGKEQTIRLFYHRLLLPFTHNSYFFEDFSVHESHYFRFLKQIDQTDLAVETEEIFGVCWFFINTIRIKANSRMTTYTLSPTDPLFLLYLSDLQALYETEGVYLKNEESVFAFSCFLDSWNYNNNYTTKITNTLSSYPFSTSIQEFVQELADHLSLSSLRHTKLSHNFILMLLKYHESPLLMEQLQSQYHYFVEEYETNYTDLYPYKVRLLEKIKTPALSINDETYFFYLLSLLTQQALLAVKPNQVIVYFLFQGEPSWKAFLQQELNASFGKRVQVKPIEYSQLAEIKFNKNDLFVSNIPIEAPPIEVIYLSTIPTKNELDRLYKKTKRSYV